MPREQKAQKCYCLLYPEHDPHTFEWSPPCICSEVVSIFQSVLCQVIFKRNTNKCQASPQTSLVAVRAGRDTAWGSSAQGQSLFSITCPPPRSTAPAQRLPRHFLAGRGWMAGTTCIIPSENIQGWKSLFSERAELEPEQKY